MSRSTTKGEVAPMVLSSGPAVIALAILVASGAGDCCLGG
jgi:hypothetical protein